MQEEAMQEAGGQESGQEPEGEGEEAENADREEKREEVPGVGLGAATVLLKRRAEAADEGIEAPPCRRVRVSEEAAPCRSGVPIEIMRVMDNPYLVSKVLSRTSPRDARRAWEVSEVFADVADSDEVWSGFIPRDLLPLADGELSKKSLFHRLSDSPVLLDVYRPMSMWLDRETAAKCYMLSARALEIAWGSTPEYWKWIPLTGSRFSECAELLDVCWLEICGKINSNMLSKNSTYAAYMVFKIADYFYGLGFPAKASVRVGETTFTHPVYLRRRKVVRKNVLFPQKRTGGWMELKLGEFFNEGGEDGEVSISLWETKGGHWKKGLIVQGVEIRPEKSR